MNDVEKAYLAGIVDGDGSICLFHKKNKTIRRGYYYEPALIISNNDKKLLDEITRITGIIYNPVKRRSWRSNPNHTQGYFFWVGRMASLLKLLKEIAPFLISKRRRAEMLIEFLEIQKELRGGVLRNRGNSSKTYDYTERQHEIFREIKRLNQRGVFE